MLRDLIEKEAAAMKGAVRVVREWVHPTKVMKRHVFDRPLDDLGQNIDDVERRVAPPEEKPGSKTTNVA